GRDHHALRRVDGRVRRHPLQLAVQPARADDLHGRQPPPGPGDHHPALLAVPVRAVPRQRQRQAPVRPVPRRDPDQHRVPDGVLRLRPEQLHEDAVPRADRSRVGRWRLRLADLPERDPAALPAGARGPRDARVHVHLQRLLLGAAPDEERRQAPDHLRSQQPPGSVLHRHEPAGGRRAPGGHPDDPRLRLPPEAVHQRADARLDEGLGARMSTVVARDTGAGPRPWLTPELTSLGRLPMHTLRHDDPDRRLELDGRWRFQLLHDPDAEPGPDWSEADVPGCWTMQGFDDLPHYTNVQMPFPGFPPAIPEDNPTGVYERDVEIPEAWGERRIVLHVGAAESVLIASFDDVEVGISKDSHLAAEFDVSEVATPGRHRLTLRVVKWSDATYVEDQDQGWHGGITRSVFLYVTEGVYLADVRAIGGLADDLTTGTIDLRVDVGAVGG